MWLIRRTVEQRIEEIVDEARTDEGRYRKLLATARLTDRAQADPLRPWSQPASFCSGLRETLLREASLLLSEDELRR